MKYRSRLIAAAYSVLAISLLGSLSEAADEKTLRRVGILTVSNTARPWFEPFYSTMRDMGWSAGKNVRFELRAAEGDPLRYPVLARELAQLKVDVIFAVGPPAVRAAHEATKTIPIVAHDLGTDPVAAGYVTSYTRPGRNLTGLFLDIPELTGKRLQLLKAVAPAASRALVIWDSSGGSNHVDALKSLAPRFDLQLQIEEVRTPADLDRVSSVLPGGFQAIVVLPSPMMYVESKRLAELASRHQLPGISMFRPFAEAGGLMAYGPEMPPTAVRCAHLVAKILKGTNPGDIPVERPTKFELVVNKRAATTLGVKLPDSILLSADEVIR